MVSRKNILKTFSNNSLIISETPQGEVGFDNPRENIDPKIKTKVIFAEEATIKTISGSNLTATNISGTNCIFTIISGSNLTSTNISGSLGRFTNLNISGAVSISGAFTFKDNSNVGLIIDSDASNALLSFGQSGTEKSRIGIPKNANGLIVGSVADDLCIRSGTNILFSIDNGTTANMTLDSSGNLGVGVVPVSKLHVQTSAGSLPSVIAQTGALRVSANGITGCNIGISSSSPYGTWIQSTNNPATGGGNYPLSFNVSGGNVGIGTLNPSETLQVDGNISVSGATGVYKYKALSGVSGDFTGATTTFKFSGGLLIGTA